jgi:hypothetical protein
LEYNEAVHHLFIVLYIAYDSYRKDVLYNILIEFGIPLKPVSVMKLYPNGTYSRVRVGKLLSDMFSIRNVLKQGNFLCH